MVNSSWTRRHIAALWWQWRRPQRVYPPCDTRALQALPLDRRLKRIYIVSVAQFRPEKDHALQLRALAAVRVVDTRLSQRCVHPSPRASPPRVPERRQTVRASTANIISTLASLQARDKAAARHDSVGDAVLGARLRLIGSCRNAEDEARIAELAGGWWLGRLSKGRTCRGTARGWQAGTAALALHAACDPHPHPRHPCLPARMLQRWRSILGLGSRWSSS